MRSSQEQPAAARSSQEQPGASSRTPTYGRIVLGKYVPDARMFSPPSLRHVPLKVGAVILAIREASRLGLQFWVLYLATSAVLRRFWRRQQAREQEQEQPASNWRRSSPSCHHQTAAALVSRLGRDGAVLRLTSKLQGSLEKILRPWGDIWLGFCPVCKRPVELCVDEIAAPAEQRSGARGRFVYVICLWGSSQDYVLGATHCYSLEPSIRWSACIPATCHDAMLPC
jgi:hypothetical protein